MSPFVIVDQDREHSGLGRDESALFVEGNAEEDVAPSATVTLSSMALQEGDILIALGSDEQLGRLKEIARGSGRGE